MCQGRVKGVNVSRVSRACQGDGSLDILEELVIAIVNRKEKVP